jgi:hypothetical protein
MCLLDPATHFPSIIVTAPDLVIDIIDNVERIEGSQFQIQRNSALSMPARSRSTFDVPHVTSSRLAGE